MLGKKGQSFVRLPYKLLSVVLVVSSIMTVFISGYQLYKEFKADLNRVEGSIDAVQRGYLKGFGTALWNHNIDQLNVMLEGVARLQGISYVELKTDSGDVHKKGRLPPGERIDSSFKLTYKNSTGIYETVGSLRVVADYGPILDSSVRRAKTVLLSQMVKTFVVSLVILFIFQRMVTRHLSTLANYIRNFQVEGKNVPIRLKRTLEFHRGVYDEIDLVVGTFNNVAENLSKSYRDQQIELGRLRSEEQRLNREKDALDSKLERQDRLLRMQADRLDELLEESLRPLERLAEPALEQCRAIAKDLGHPGIRIQVQEDGQEIPEVLHEPLRKLIARIAKFALVRHIEGEKQSSPEPSIFKISKSSSTQSLNISFQDHGTGLVVDPTSHNNSFESDGEILSFLLDGQLEDIGHILNDCEAEAALTSERQATGHYSFVLTLSFPVMEAPMQMDLGLAL